MGMSDDGEGHVRRRWSSGVRWRLGRVTPRRLLPRTLAGEVIAAAVLLLGAVVVVVVALFLWIPGRVDPATVAPRALEVEVVRPPPPKPPPLPEPARRPPERRVVLRGHLAGTVVTAEGKPVWGARVIVMQSKRQAATGLTDSRGRFSVGTLRGRGFEVRTTHALYPQVVSGFDTLPRRPVTIVLERGGNLAGRVMAA